MSVDDTNSNHAGFSGLSWDVHKFGGTSVADASCYTRVAEIIERELGQDDSNNNHRLAVVVSAMGGKPKVTDLLLESVSYAAERNDVGVHESLEKVRTKHATCLAALFEKSNASEQDRLAKIIEKDISDIKDILKTVSLMKWRAERISELVSGYGELWSAQILTSLMQQRAKQWMTTSTNTGHQFSYLDARRVITVDEDAIANGAIVWEVSQAKLNQVYEEDTATVNLASTPFHFIITGYVASNTHGVATTLQRDGSDYSAAIMGRLLQSNMISIWTDVDGVLSADPRRVPQAQVLTEVSYNEAMELAYFGAKVIHPKTMQPAISASPQIPIYIRNTFNASFRGTRIYTSSTTHTDRDKVVCGFSSIEHMALINVEGSGLIGVPGVAKRMFATLERVGVNVVLISQASSEHSVTFATTEDQAMIAKEAIEEEFGRELKQNRISNVDVKMPCSIIAAVGDGMSATTGVSGRFFSALGDAQINVLAIAQGCSERNISAVVWTEESTRALRAVHAAFRLSHVTVRVAVIGMNEVGDSLLKLLDSQRGAIRSTFELDLQVCAVLPNAQSDELVRLKIDTDGSSDSITINAFNKVSGGAGMLGAAHASFQDEKDVALSSSGGLDKLLDALVKKECTSHAIFDCTNDEILGKCHAQWLRAGVDVVTANNTGLSASKEQREDLFLAEKALGKQSAGYLREVTVGGGLPIIGTLRNLLQSGDKIRRIDGILSVSLSFILFRVSPPPDFSACSEFDERSSNGAFVGDLSMSPSSKVDAPCSFSQALKEAIALGLMEEDPTKDLNNEYTSRVLMVLARELGMEADVEIADIQSGSEKLLEMILHKDIDYHNIPEEVDRFVKERVDGARARGCVLRHVASVDVSKKRIEIRLMDVPAHHIFSVTPPSCECVRFFTHRHRRYPLIVQGPSAGADSTASALLAELLQRVRGKANPRSVALSRSAAGLIAIARNTSGNVLRPEL